MLDARQYAAATERNRQPILSVFQQVLPKTGTVLEISSGTGEHITFWAPHFPQLHWLPSEPQALLRASIQAWGERLPAENLWLPPLDLDVSVLPWPVERAGEGDRFPAISAIVNVNMIHIAAWEMCEHLVAGAGRILSAGGLLYLYGPFKRAGQQTAPSNEAFDRLLRDRNPAWGIRDLEAVVAIAQKHHLQLSQVIDMPANNLSVVFHRL